MKSASGSIRKKTVTRNGKSYVYWEARYTAGYDPQTGAQLQRSVSGKTQKEVRQKLTLATAQLDTGTYLEPTKITLGAWLDTWAANYLRKIKPATVASYKSMIRNHIAPALGGIRLCQLSNIQIQAFYSGLYDDGLSPKTVLNIHGALHKALAQAVKSKLIRDNPADNCELTKAPDPDIKPLSGSEIAAFFQAIKGQQYENLFTVILLLGLRQSEALGLTWENINWETGAVTIEKQLTAGTYQLAPTKNSEVRTITASPTALDALRREKLRQTELRLRWGVGWDPTGLVFADDSCEHLCHSTVYKAFKRIAAQIGRPDARLHDLRHSYAVISLQAGDDIKTVQAHLGHATAAFTLDVYGHVLDEVHQASADRQEAFLEKIKNA